MWFNILPSFFIITASIGLPGYGLWWLHKLCLGNHYRRTLTDRWDRHMYQRDVRISGDAYKLLGLETILDPLPPPPCKRPKREKPDNVRF